MVHILLAAAAVSALVAQEPPKPVVKFGIPVAEGPMDSLRLKDYAPASSLVVPKTRVAKARFPVIDVHSHTSMSGIKTRADVDAWVKTMDEAGVDITVVFTEATGAEFDRQAALYLTAYPKRFQVWCGVDTKDLGSPDYPERAALELAQIGRAHV